MLKQTLDVPKPIQMSQPPSGGCVLKRKIKDADGRPIFQPPSGGCVLKRA